MSGPGMRPSAVLFACGMNSVRSPMAEALTAKLFPGQVYVRSAGVRSGKVDPFVDAVMAEIGVDMGKHVPKTFEDLDESGFDLVVTLAPEAHHKALDMTRTESVDVEYWPTLDPTLATGSREQILDEYRAVRDQLMMRIKKRLDWTPPPSG
ncbi:low molecular weight phosphatase family protein [Roseibium aggregatum]|uniref:Putative arsenate reductase (Phosphatase) protein n=1 Tax=Roseibium aggregatum (strain ATCC 25650 / DSM 13394 / JCM 20685 / NBRC 16684 / NCIMB 2208 / IAM 12614 / B1) TaxID=384765 RepID=A0P235_ROSAI|nr:putative arsenate reductase (phosphatase) protein [Stappia aggregata IAM 12614] [Roseibium aggregatum IAM 12614]